MAKKPKPRKARKGRMFPALRRGLKQSRKGKVKDLGDFTKYAK